MTDERQSVRLHTIRLQNSRQNGMENAPEVQLNGLRDPARHHSPFRAFALFGAS